MKKKKSHKKKIKCKGTLNTYVWLIGFLGLPFFLMMLILSIKSGTFAGSLIFGLLLLMDIYAILLINWKIDYDSNGFTYRNIFRISKHYSYSQITKIRMNKESYLYIGRKRILIDSSLLGRKDFLITATRNARNAIKLTAKDEKLFNGNVKNPMEFVVISIILPVLPIGMMIFAWFAFSPAPLEELNHVSIKLADCVQEYDDNQNLRLRLIPETSEINYILYEQNHHQIDADSLLQDIENGKVFDIYYRDSENDTQRIRQISADKLYLSLEDFNADEFDDRDSILIMGGIMLILELLYIAVQNHILNHADRYPNAVKHFVREDYLVRK